MAQRKSRKRGNPASTGRSSKAPTKRPPRGYRLSARTINRWTRVLTYTMLSGYAVGAVVALIGLLIHDDTMPALGLGVAALVTAVALVGGAYLGGQSLARFGGLVALGFLAGVGLAIGGKALASWVPALGVVIAALSTIGLFLLGIRRRVPMWLGARNDGSPNN
ncbi:hypothetical protein SAMN04515691_3891 [Leifsonia sp. 98AMF]|uniref:hypothetical protein n=1 Tax=unclassified Leifsonia TaxID=2663824 RepID=UPI00087CD97C|nr:MULTISPECIES: hypothetical protein [unclassified Leifsonia]SDG98033.1 hypothetical protein SAMN04515690_0126 [Leifsonia sp. 197AMF]SDJ43449.1 hypothetical protein SAMN04515684_3657 [Leifsonia sp. 466MF]SDK33208.1 hypothetical protein SAMN04515683_3108 [Leifsonia sp. 157MF]SDN63856.1 hypothetical protein SAMN04515686_1844 [Leifsonia sp. 509MF]SEN45093.1 hypothetical protein SAMN04515685_3091 [Leifsonia sp. 467MF]